MKVNELIRRLSNFDGNKIVALASDSEGNSIKDIDEVTKEEQFDGIEDSGIDADEAVIIWPIE